MKVILLIAAVAAQGSARHQSQTNNPHEWIAPGPNDFRGPCPMLNTLSNHGFFPRDGRNITKANAVAGLKNGINFNGTLGEIMWDQAIIVNPEPNATFFTLEQLSLHGILEHDANLTRTDAFFGNNRVFNETVYKQSRQWWTDEVVTVKQLAHSKIFRQIESRAQNPNYTFSATTEEFSIGEVAAPIIVFGDMASGTVQRDLMEYFFVNERLPEELGWTKKSNEITLMDILSTTAMVRNATSLITGPSAEAPESPHTARDLHAGLVTAL